MLVGTEILGGIKPPFGPIYRDGKAADPKLLDVLILEICGNPGEMP